MGSDERTASGSDGRSGDLARLRAVARGAGRRTVVGAAVVDGGRVLAARRTAPADVAGRWELPGGKVDGDESPTEALVRELREELGCEVRPVHWLSGVAVIGSEHVLRVALCRLVSGEPTPSEHDAIRWLGPDELDDVDWLGPDRPFLAHLGHLLRAEPPPVSTRRPPGPG